jgi:hypothetical protein
MYFSDNIGNNYSKVDKKKNRQENVMIKKKLLLPVVFLTSILFNSCSTFPVIIFGKFYEEYDFVNRKNKNISIGNSQRDSPKLKLKNVNFFLGFYKDFDKKKNEDKSNIYYEPTIYIYALKDKYIDHILINNVAVYADGTEYSMLERVKSVILDLTPKYNDTSYIRLNEEKIADVQRTGIINHFINTDNENTPINTKEVTVIFSSVPIDQNCKEVKILYDVYVKYTTGEEIIVKQEVIGLKKKKLYFVSIPWWAFLPSA